MRTEENGWYKTGSALGYILAYFVFTTFLFFAFTLLKKTPEGWRYPEFMLITAAISILGALLMRWLR